MFNQILTCRDLGNAMKRLIENGNLSKAESRLYVNFFNDGKNNVRPVIDLAFDGKVLTFKTGLYEKGMLIYKFANRALDISYKYKIHLNEIKVNVENSQIRDVEGDSILKRCVLVV